MILQPIICFYSLFSQTTNAKLCNKVCRFSRICTAQPHFADEMLRLVLGLRCPRPSPKRAPVRDSTTIVSESDLARQLNRSVRTHSSVSRRWAGSPGHQNLAAFRIDSVHAWIAQKKRKPAANVPLFWPTAPTRFLNKSPTYRSVADGSSIGLRPWCSNSFF